MPRAFRMNAKPAVPSIPASTVLPTAPVAPTPTAYPTPPPSPDLEETSSLIRKTRLIAVQLDDIDDDDEIAPVSDDEIDTDFIRTLPIPKLGASPQIPIPILLDTPYALPHAATFRLRSPASLLALVAGSRVLELDSGQTIWDRMPYSAAAAAIHSRRPVTDEDAVEALVSGDKPGGSANGLHWSMRHKNDTSSSIFVHPPTPERDGTLPSLDAAGVAMTSAKTVPTVLIPSPPGGSKSVPLPLQVLPEVRSPPRRTIAMAADSLQLTQRRGRRPRLFGFTEMNDGSGSSAGSSAANSRQTSPERPASPALPTSPAPGPDFIPRRTPLRARSETDLLTVGATRASAPTITHPSPRRKENGLKLDFTGIVPIANPIESQSCIVPSPYSARLIRKKSGEILKPALKYGGPLAPNGTPLGGPRTDISPDSPASARFESKSCPTTPSCPKYVHFNPQLEQVKLFLHDQKPQVVSRSGSPSEHYTTSEGEEYPFPSTDEERDEKKVLQIKLPNFPTSHMPDTDLYLESLFLDDDRKNLRGMILCKNYSYHKWVAVRFTFDFWQTTSEVTATFKDSVKGGKYDRFSFTIKLHDLMPRIEEKTMFLATRYTTDGREIWDSNGGQNYQVLFEKVRPAAVTTVPKRNSVSIQPGMGQAVGGRTSQWSVTGGNADDRLADLRAKLSRLSADDATSSPPQLSPNRTTFAFSPNRRGSSLAKGPSSPSGSPARTLSALDARTSDLPSAGPALAARYDFGNALKTTRRSSPNSQKTELPEVQTGLLNYGSRVNHGHAATEFYSPRFSPRPLPDATMQSTDMLFSPPLPVEYPVSPTTITGLVPSPLAVPNLHVQAPSPSPTEEVPTPTAAMSSPKRPALGRSRTTPAVLSSPRDSPPSLDTPTGSLTDTASESPRSPPDMTLPKWSPTGSSSEKSDMSLASYSSFIEQFCWGGVAPSVPDAPRRTHSASSLDAYFAQAHEQSRPQSNGTSTPRPRSYPNGSGYSGYDSPGSVSSYYTSASTPTARDEMDAAEDGLRLDRGSPRIMAVRMDSMGMGRMSPTMAC